MFQLILGISLGLLLLFVILLLVTEVAATYPVWKHLNRSNSPDDTAAPYPGQKTQNPSRVLLLILAGISVLGMLGYLAAYRTNEESPPKIKAKQAANGVQTKLLSASSADRSIFFRLQTKWQDGKLYGNNSVTFHIDSVWRLNDCRYFLLDYDGFLIKQILFSPTDFVFETAPGGRIQGLVNKFNTELSLDEYQKIEKLQVALDNQIFPPSP